MIEALRESFQILTASAKRKFIFLSLSQVLLSLLDLVGILLVGAVAALGIRGVGGEGTGDRVGQVLNFMNLGNLTLTQQITILGGIATILLTTKTLLSAVITRKTYDFLSKNCAELTTTLMKEISGQTRDVRNNRNSQEIIFAVSDGARIIIVAMLGAATLLLADLSLILTLCFGLALLNIQVAAVSIVYFSIVAIIIYVTLQKRMLRLGGKMTTQQIKTNQEILELLTASREISVSGKTDLYIGRIRNAQKNLLQTISDFTFTPLLGKYIIEASLVFGALLLGYLEFHLQDPYRAIASVSVFIAAGTRMAPALLRFQNSALLIKGSKGASNSTFDLIKDLKRVDPSHEEFLRPISQDGLRTFEPEVKFSNLIFTYEGEIDPTIKLLNLEVKTGSTIAIVGASGSGKSTVLDLILGILEPQNGEVEISGQHPRTAISRWPGSIGYVPQQVAVFNKSMLENIAIGVERSEINSKQIEKCLSMADLEAMVLGLDQGLDTILQESGNNISGGQKQRIGLARALYTSPSLLILDEATSALDVQSEAKIISNLKEEYGNCTLILVTHRISVAKSADHIIYFKDGEIRSQGSFEEVKKDVGDFEQQAFLSGL